MLVALICHNPVPDFFFYSLYFQYSCHNCIDWFLTLLLTLYCLLYYSRYGFVLRIVLLLVIAWMTLLVINSALIVVPISLGRALFNAIPLLPITHGVKCNGNIVNWVTYSSHASCFLMKMLTYFLVFPLDLYAFIIGSYVIWTAVAGARYSIEHVRTKRAAILFKQIWKWCGIVVKSCALLSIWVRVILVIILLKDFIN